MNRVTVRRFDVVRTANIVAALYAVIVIVVMLVFFVPFMLIGGLAGMAGAGEDAGAGAAVLGAGLIGTLVFLVLGAVFYAVIGWVMTAIMVLLYNWLAGRIGGFQLDVQVDGPWPGASGGYSPYGGYPAAPGYGQPQAPSWPAPGSPAAPGHGSQPVAPQGGPNQPPPPGYPSGS
jgi:hypothetical protein